MLYFIKLIRLLLVARRNLLKLPAEKIKGYGLSTMMKLNDTKKSLLVC
jgi:hypothetical protein